MFVLQAVGRAQRRSRPSIVIAASRPVNEFTGSMSYCPSNAIWGANMRRSLVAIAVFLAAVCTPLAANAQFTNCTTIGNNTSCHTMGGNDYRRNDGAVGQGLSDLIAGINERRVRSQVGKLLAEGDCEGAARLAFEKGRLEMGLAIREQCAPSPARLPSVELARQLQAIAARAQTPAAYGDDLTVTAVQAVQTQLWLTVQYNREGAMPLEYRQFAKTEICRSPDMQELLVAGATVWIFFLAPNGSQLAKEEASASVCGLN